LGYTLLATYILNVASSLQSADGEEAMIAEFEVILPQENLQINLVYPPDGSIANFQTLRVIPHLIFNI